MLKDKRQAAVFLDRDGTINEEVGYLDRLDNLRLLPGASEAIRRINAGGMKAVVITNQSGVARGLYDEAFVSKTHALLRELLRRAGAHLDGIYFCPHHPREGRGEYLRVCDCRKPAPGLILRAEEELGLDLSHSWMIGDTLNDIEAGTRAGVRRILVRTGMGEEELRKLEETASSRKPYGTAATIRAGAEGILVRTGYGEEELRKLDAIAPSGTSERNPTVSDGGTEKTCRQADPRQPEFVAADLLEAVEWILRSRRP